MSTQHVVAQDAEAYNDRAAHSHVLASNGIFASSNMGHGGYVINADLLAGTGKFVQAAAYQRLYL